MLRPAFPIQVDERRARLVAAGVALLAAAAAVTAAPGLAALLAAGFLLRVGWGPRLSPLALLAGALLRRWGGDPRLVPGAPKRFAQLLGLLAATTAALLLAAGAPTAGRGVLLALLLLAGLEAGRGWCAGCWLFARLFPRRCLRCA